MYKIAATFFLLILSFGVPGQAKASILVEGSTYNITLFINGTGVYSFFNLRNSFTFDGIGESASLFQGGPAFVSESLTDLGHGCYRIGISIESSNADLFPQLLPAHQGGFIGILGDSLDFSRDVKLISAVVSFYQGSALFGYADFIRAIANPDPWDGLLVGNNRVAGFRDVRTAGIGITRVEMNFTVFDSSVPEPSSWAIWAFSALAMGAFVIRRRIQTVRWHKTL